jgi:hypothetical protein
MSNNVTYSFVSAPETGSMVFRSTVNSYGLDHVTDKDLSSFYASFSSLAYFDTGLLPVDGTGMLSIRSAGPHTQIAYQHAPGMYYVNWGSYEGDPSAQKYYVAQPYRIIIADIYNNNLLGARTFYSPHPITHPNAQLYHVNLPNINCRGYRGTSVGWICLYHNEDISSYPFNEKVAKIIDRCSGTESYNDQNMSETDGARFYFSHNKPEYLSNPKLWEEHSNNNSIDWVLDEDLWIPILVNHMDDQGSHNPNGEPLTFLMAILGNYQCYYTDPIIPKPVNALSRLDLEVTQDMLFNWFKLSYNSSTSTSFSKNPYTESLSVRQNISTTQIKVNTSFFPDNNEEEQEEDEDHIFCAACNDYYQPDDVHTIYGGDIYCVGCLANHTVWVDHMETYVDSDDENLLFSDTLDNYYLIGHWQYYKTCLNCSSFHVYDPDNKLPETSLNIWRYTNPDTQEVTEVCAHCIHTADQNYTCSPCSQCSDLVPYQVSEDITLFSNITNNNFNTHIIKPQSQKSLTVCCNLCYDTIDPLQALSDLITYFN